MGHHLNGYDYDGTLDVGNIKPKKPFVVITGRTWFEGKPDVPDAVGIFMRGDGRVGDREAAGRFKAQTIERLGVQSFWENDPLQVAIIQDLCPEVKVHLANYEVPAEIQQKHRVGGKPE